VILRATSILGGQKENKRMICSIPFITSSGFRRYIISNC